MPTRAHRSTVSDTLHVLAAAGKVLGGWWVQQASDTTFSSSPGPHCPLIPLDQAGLGALWPSLLQSLFRHSLGGMGPCTNVLVPHGQDITWARHGVCCSYRLSNATILIQWKWQRGRRKEEWKNSSALIAVGFGADLMRKITPRS